MQVPDLVRLEQERARMGLVFLPEHPTRPVCASSSSHLAASAALGTALTAVGPLNEASLQALAGLAACAVGHSDLAMETAALPAQPQSVWRALFAREARARWAQLKSAQQALLVAWVVLKNTATLPFRGAQANPGRGSLSPLPTGAGDRVLPL